MPDDLRCPVSVEGWTAEAETAFFESWGQFWPSSRAAKPADAPELCNQILEAVRQVSPASAMEAISRINSRGEPAPKMPALRKALDEVWTQYGHAALFEGNVFTTREKLINRLRVIAVGDEPAYWMSPRGHECRIRPHGLEFFHPRRRTLICLWSELTEEDLKRILANNETAIRREVRAEQISWEEFKRRTGRGSADRDPRNEPAALLAELQGREPGCEG